MNRMTERSGCGAEMEVTPTTVGVRVDPHDESCVLEHVDVMGEEARRQTEPVTQLTG